MIFKTAWILSLIPIFIGLVYIFKKRQKPTAIQFSSVKLASSVRPTWRVRLRKLPFILRLIILALFLLALAGPQSLLQETVYKAEGIDIVLAIDASGSMAAEDFKVNGKRVNRLEVVKQVVKDFIDQRRNDRLGLVAFAGLAYAVSPLTTDHGWLTANLERIELNLIKGKTAIGSALASSIIRLQNSDAKSKVIILLTDGINNAGEVDPKDAAQAAQAFDIKIYTIGAGSRGEVPFPTRDFFGRRVYEMVRMDLDEEMLKEVAQITDGQYFRATDAQSLKSIYDQINQLEKTEIEEFGFREVKEHFDKVLMAALALLLLEILLSNTLILKIP